MKLRLRLRGLLTLLIHLNWLRNRLCLRRKNGLIGLHLRLYWLIVLHIGLRGPQRGSPSQLVAGVAESQSDAKCQQDAKKAQNQPSDVPAGVVGLVSSCECASIPSRLAGETPEDIPVGADSALVDEAVSGRRLIAGAG